MQSTARVSDQVSATGCSPEETSMLQHLDYCLQQGCFICIEHADMVHPRQISWVRWEQPSRYRGDLNAIYDAIESCRSAHADHHIRLSIEDITWHSRLSLVVYRPHLAQTAPGSLRPAQSSTGLPISGDQPFR